MPSGTRRSVIRGSGFLSGCCAGTIGIQGCARTVSGRDALLGNTIHPRLCRTSAPPIATSQCWLSVGLLCLGTSAAVGRARRRLPDVAGFGPGRARCWLLDVAKPLQGF